MYIYKCDMEAGMWNLKPEGHERNNIMGNDATYSATPL